YIIFLTPLFNQWNDITQALMILVIAQILWIGRVFPMAYTSLIAFLLMSLQVSSFEKIIASLGEEIVWLIFATFILSSAFEESGLAERISLNMLKASRGDGKLLLLIL